jgi:hypothetical protein
MTFSAVMVALGALQFLCVGALLGIVLTNDLVRNDRLSFVWSMALGAASGVLMLARALGAA